MEVATELRAARQRAGLTQTQLASRSGTSQATISAYESGRKQPSLDTLDRLLSATGSRLAIVPGASPVVQPSAAQHARVGAALVDVLAVAQAMPRRQGRRLAFSPLAPRVTLGQKLLALHETLARAGVPHAFGGAVALAYWTLEPRGTTDVDLNVFVPPAECERVLRALPEDVERPSGAAQAILAEGRVRLRWEDTPIDLFFATDSIHGDAARHARTVPFGDGRLPVLGPVELAALKAIGDRDVDWADVAALLVAGTLDVDAARAVLRRQLAGEDPRVGRFEGLAERVAVSGAGGRRGSF
jgi:transcriptional regulator with XRE-family HTH domain